MQLIKTLVIISAMAFMASCNSGEASTKTVNNETETVADSEVAGTAAEANSSSASVKYLNTDEFINTIFDYKTNTKEWVYKGDKPAIIDFYTDWCGPCKRVAPIMEELSTEYDGQIRIYKMNTEKEPEVAAIFGIRSIPSILYIPVNGQPTMYTGAYPKQHYIDLINEKLLTK